MKLIKRIWDALFRGPQGLSGEAGPPGPTGASGAALEVRGLQVDQYATVTIRDRFGDLLWEGKGYPPEALQ